MNKQANNQITEKLKDELAQRAEHIRGVCDCATKHLIEHVVIIGRNLVEAKKICPHGEWLPWLKREFDWSHSTADRFMQVYRQKDKLPTVGNFDIPLNVLYLLAAPSTPPEARQEIKDRIEGGEHVSAAQVKEAIADTKQTKLDHGRNDGSLEHGCKQVARLEKYYGDPANYSLPPIQYDLIDQVKPPILQMNWTTKEALVRWIGEVFHAELYQD
jgi:Protein of unknown function (DUF3102)